MRYKIIYADTIEVLQKLVNDEIETHMMFKYKDYNYEFVGGVRYEKFVGFLQTIHYFPIINVQASENKKEEVRDES